MVFMSINELDINKKYYIETVDKYGIIVMGKCIKLGDNGEKKCL